MQKLMHHVLCVDARRQENAFIHESEAFLTRWRETLEEMRCARCDFPLRQLFEIQDGGPFRRRQRHDREAVAACKQLHVLQRRA